MKRRYLWSVLLIGYAAFVFSNSMKAAVESAQQSSRALELAQQILDGVGLGNIGITEHFIRKAAHFAEYTCMGLLIFQTVRSFQRPWTETVLCIMLLGILIPFADETIQLFVEGRSGQISDVWLDMSGVFAGTMIMVMLSGILKWHRSNGEKKK